MPSLVAVVDRALLGAGLPARGETAGRGPLGRRRLGGAHRRPRGAASSPRLRARRRPPRPRPAARLRRRRGVLPRAVRLARRPAARRQRAGPRARPAREGRPRAGRAPRALLVPAPRQGRRGRRGDRRGPHAGRPGRDAAAAPAARRRLDGPRRHAAEERRPAAAAARRVAPRGARVPRRARSRVARGSVERRRLAHAQPRPPRAACRTSKSASIPACAPPSRGPRTCSPRKRSSSAATAERALAEAARREGDSLVVDRAALARSPLALARATLRLALLETGGLAGVDAGHVERLLRLVRASAPSGRRIPLPGGREARFTHHALRLERRAIRATKAVSSSRKTP